MKDVLRQSESALRIKEFMRRAGRVIPDRPTIPDEKTRILRAKLILEEALETVRALGVSVKASVQINDMRWVDAVLADPDDTDGESELKFDLSGESNLTEIADGCADIKVVTDGTLIACGIAGEAVQELVDESNLAKFEPPKCKECGAVMELRDGVWEESSSPNGGMRTIRRWVCTDWGPKYNSAGMRQIAGHPTRSEDEGPWTRDDGRHIKPPYWKKPDIEGLLKEQTRQAEIDSAENVAMSGGTGLPAIQYMMRQQGKENQTLQK